MSFHILYSVPKVFTSAEPAPTSSRPGRPKPRCPRGSTPSGVSRGESCPSFFQLLVTADCGHRIPHSFSIVTLPSPLFRMCQISCLSLRRTLVTAFQICPGSRTNLTSQDPQLDHICSVLSRHTKEYSQIPGKDVYIFGGQRQY